MKKLHITVTAFLLAVFALLLSGCSKQSDTSLSDLDNSTSSEISNSNSSSENSGNSDNSESSDSDPEPPKPDGEPTFLTTPDGTPIYTSEISEIYTGSEQWNDKNAITLEQAEQMAQSGEGSFTVKCDGFVYGYVPDKALNRVDNPEMFKDQGDGINFTFLGELYDNNSMHNLQRTNLIRFKIGDKFGDLTVKNAYTLFNNNKKIDDVSNVFGVHINDGYIEFDGEVEIEGYIYVQPMETFYGTGGDMEFYPNGESSTKLPCVSPWWVRESNEYYAVTQFSYYGYFGDWTIDLGNMFNVDCDTSGLHPGDTFVKVIVTLDNVRYIPGDFGGMKADLKNIEVI